MESKSNVGSQSYTVEKTIEIYLGQLDDMVVSSPYLSFCIMSAMIELFGKMINPKSSLTTTSKSRSDFKYAIENLQAFSLYKGIKDVLYKSLRNSLVHGLYIKSDVQLSPTSANISQNQIGAQDLLESLKEAWKEVKQDDVAKTRISQYVYSVENSVTAVTQDNSYKQI